MGGLLDTIKDNGIALVVFVPHQVFEADAWKFLEFSKLDFSEHCERGLVNALGNAKRAVVNRVDVLLYAYGLRAHARKKNWSYPDKAEALRQVGVFVPDALRNLITSPRNELEHDYALPHDERAVAIIFEVAELFLRSTDPLVNRGFFRLAVGPRSLNMKYDLTTMKVADLPKESFGVLVDHRTRSISTIPLTASSTVVFSEIKANEIAELFRILSASIEQGSTKILGPVMESSFKESFL
jgi:hypothetical protein